MPGTLAGDAIPGRCDRAVMSARNRMDVTFPAVMQTAGMSVRATRRGWRNGVLSVCDATELATLAGPKSRRSATLPAW